MAAGGQVFEMLYQLSELGETKYVSTYNTQICLKLTFKGSKNCFFYMLAENHHMETATLVFVFEFNVPPIAKVIWKQGHCLKSLIQQT